MILLWWGKSRSVSYTHLDVYKRQVLNLGLNDVSVEGLARKTGNPRFAYDSYRRFIMMFADVVIGVSKSKFERKLDEYKEQVGAKYDTDLSLSLIHI